MSNLVKIQKIMRVLSIIARILFVFAVVGTILSSVAATLVATDVINEQNEFMNFITDTANMTKTQIVGLIASSAISLLFSAILTGFVCSYFTEELKEGTPFTIAGAKRIMVLGILEMVFFVVSMGIVDALKEKIQITTDSAGNFTYSAGNFTYSAGNFTLGICLIFLSLIFRYGAELEQKTKEK